MSIFEDNSNNIELYKELITSVHTDLYRYIYRIVKNKHLTDDILQNTLLIAYEKLYQLRDNHSFKSWIFTIAKNETLKILKKNSKEIAADIEEYENIIQNTFSSNSQQEVSSEIFDLLRDVISELNPNEQDIISLIYYSDLSLKEAAVTLDINYGALKAKHSRLKKKMHKKLQKRLSESKQFK